MNTVALRAIARALKDVYPETPKAVLGLQPVTAYKREQWRQDVYAIAGILTDQKERGSFLRWCGVGAE